MTAKDGKIGRGVRRTSYSQFIDQETMHIRLSLKVRVGLTSEVCSYVKLNF